MRAVLSLVGAVLSLFVATFIVTFAWNYLVPPVFAGPPLTYWQAMCGVWLIHVVQNSRPSAARHE